MVGKLRWIINKIVISFVMLKTNKGLKSKVSGIEDNVNNLNY